MERNPQRELLVSCGMWIVAWRLSRRYCLSFSQQHSSWALTPHVPCGLEDCTPSTWTEIHSVSCWFRAECGLCRLATFASLLPVIFATRQLGTYSSRPVWSRGLHAQRMERNPQRELLVSCGMWIVALQLSPRYCLSFSQQQSSWALTPHVPCGLEDCTPSTWTEIHSVSCWFRAECGLCRLATFASLLPVIFATTRQLGTYSSRPVWS